MRLGQLLASRGDRARGLIRKPEQAADLEAAGIEPVICDLEGDCDVPAAIRGADAVVFAAGAGPGSGAERKWTMDYGGAAKLVDAADANGIRRYVIVSSMGADNPPPKSSGAVFGQYLRAKAAADAKVSESGLDYTIVRPGSLTNDPGTGMVEAAPSLGKRGEIPREDVAHTIVAALERENTFGKTFEVLSGDTPIEEALDRL